MDRIKISLPVYLNSVPFLYALEHSDLMNQVELSRDIPSLCADKLRRGEVDLGLVPVVEMLRIPDARVVSDWCIGANGPIRTVVLASGVPLQEIDTLYLDAHSRTSVTLARVLAREYWQIAPRWIVEQPGQQPFVPSGRAGAIRIGDKAFDVQAPFLYDLGEEWKRFTGMPFVFAAWVANRSFDSGFIQLFEQSLENGILRLDEVLREWAPRVSAHIDLDAYWKKNVDFRLDHLKQKAMELFLEKVRAGGFQEFLPD